jgi:DnaJ-class molecular chaperone
MYTHYHVLGGSTSADHAVIKKAYYNVLLTHHPDKTIRLPEAERAQREHIFKLANAAFEVLFEPAKHRTYDQNFGIGQNQNKDYSTTTESGPFNDHEPRPTRSSTPPSTQGPEDFNIRISIITNSPPARLEHHPNITGTTVRSTK